MLREIIVGAATVLVLGGCTKAVEGASASASRGRYAGVGVYSSGRMWSQVTRSGGANANPAAARLADDEQIIVVIDSRTGEIRQCGNLSGYCVGMNPWSATAPQAPAALAKHAEDLLRDDAATPSK